MIELTDHHRGHERRHAGLDDATSDRLKPPQILVLPSLSGRKGILLRKDPEVDSVGAVDLRFNKPARQARALAQHQAGV